MRIFLFRLMLASIILLCGLPAAGCGSGCAGAAAKNAVPAVVKVTAGGITCSGIVAAAPGYILTDCEVVKSGDEISVSFLPENDIYAAEPVWKDERGDAAILMLKTLPETISVAAPGDAEAVKAGDTVIALSHASDAVSVAEGTVRSHVDRNDMQYIQTDIALAPAGNGGPLVNCKGEIIGFFSKKTEASISDSAGCAIPINSIKPIIDKLIREGELKIENVEIPSSFITQNSAVITWETSRPSAYIVYYETDSQSYMPSVNDEMDDTHKLVLKNLEADTAYRLAIYVRDSDKFEAKTTGLISFQTKKPGTISDNRTEAESDGFWDSVKICGLTDRSATFTWQTEREAAGTIVYGITSSYGSEAAEREKTTTHSITISDLIPNTTYHYRIKTGEGIEESPDSTFTTFKQICNKPRCRAPDFALISLSDNVSRLDDFSGKKLIILFTGTSCGTCMQQVKYLQEIYNADPDPDYSIVLITETPQYHINCLA